MNELIEQAEALGITVDKRWSEETLREKIANQPPAAPVDDNPKMFPVKLVKNYRPRNDYKVVGEPVAPPYPGVGGEDKLWAGTVVELPPEEAKALIENVAVSMVSRKDEMGRPIREKVSLKRPLAERADAFPA